MPKNRDIVSELRNGKFKNGALLAPMAGVTDRAFRSICLDCGALSAITEMVSCKAVEFGNKKTALIYGLEDSASPEGVQIFGNNPNVMASATRRILEDITPDFIDINMGCPVPKIVKNGEGSALMLDEALAYDIVSAVVQASTVPVTCKIRLGFTKDRIKAADFARVLEQAGAAFVSVHARTRDMFYAGNAMLDEIALVKQAVSIPVIANGDIFTPESAKAAFEITGADAIMIGRGAMGAPWLFSQVSSFLQTGSYLKAPPLKTRAEYILRQYRHMCEYKPTRVALLEMRKHAAWYLKGLENMASVRASINRCENEDAFISLVCSLA